MTEKSLDQPIRFSQTSVRLDTLFKVITRQTGVRFSYNSRRLKSSYRLKLSSTKLSARQLLDELKQKTGVIYTVIGNQIVLNLEKSTVQQPAKPDPKPVEMVQQPARSIEPARITKLITQQEQDSITIPIDSAQETKITPEQQRLVSTAVPEDSIKNIQPKQTPVAAQKKIDLGKTPPATVVKKSAPKKKSYFVDLGVSAEETLFMGATIQGGIPKIFGSISLKSNGKSVILLYGLGTTFQIKKRSQILLTAQYGPYSKSFNYTQSNSDSTVEQYAIEVKGTWARAGIGLERKLNSKGNVKLYTGLNFNALESRYSVNGQDFGLNGISASEPERKFSAFYPFYTITDNYGDTVFASMKTWIGIQVGINFTIIYP